MAVLQSLLDCVSCTQEESLPLLAMQSGLGQQFSGTKDPISIVHSQCHLGQEKMCSPWPLCSLRPQINPLIHVTEDAISQHYG